MWHIHIHRRRMPVSKTNLPISSPSIQTADIDHVGLHVCRYHWDHRKEALDDTGIEANVDTVKTNSEPEIPLGASIRNIIDTNIDTISTN